MFKRIKTLPACLLATLALGLGLGTVAEADADHLPDLPISDSARTTDLWLCDLPSLDIYLDSEAGGGAYFIHDSKLIPISEVESLVLGFVDRQETMVTLHPHPSGSVEYRVDNGSLQPIVPNGGVYQYRVTNEFSTYDFAGVPFVRQPGRAPSMGKVTIQSDDACPPPGGGGF